MKGTQRPDIRYYDSMAGLLLRGPKAHPQAWRGGLKFVPGLGKVRRQIQVSTKDQFLMGRVVQPQRSESLSLGRHAAEGI